MTGRLAHTTAHTETLNSAFQESGADSKHILKIFCNRVLSGMAVSEKHNVIGLAKLQHKKNMPRWDGKTPL